MKNNKGIEFLGKTILPGESKSIDVEIAKLHTMTKLKIPVIIERSKIDVPTVFFSACLHGDEINRTAICIPIINVFDFLNQTREFPDKRDLNRVFLGSKIGSLASRFVYFLVTEIIPGGASRFNEPQIRIAPNNQELKKLVTVFNSHLPYIQKTFQVHLETQVLN